MLARGLRMKRKYLPFLICALFFMGFLTLQLATDLFAAPGKMNSSKEKKIELKLSGFKPVMSDGKNYISQNKKFLIINFWASWCAPCLKELPSLIDLYAKNKDKIEIVGVNCDEDEKSMKRVESLYKLSFLSVKDPELKWMDYFGYSKLPTTLIFKDGKLVYQNEEFTDFAKIDLDKL
jgi:thiol-disulfide isomerase/thioredoxin